MSEKIYIWRKKKKTLGLLKNLGEEKKKKKNYKFKQDIQLVKLEVSVQLINIKKSIKQLKILYINMRILWTAFNINLTKCMQEITQND